MLLGLAPTEQFVSKLYVFGLSLFWNMKFKKIKRKLFQDFKYFGNLLWQDGSFLSLEKTQILIHLWASFLYLDRKIKLSFESHKGNKTLQSLRQILTKTILLAIFKKKKIRQIFLFLMLTKEYVFFKGISYFNINSKRKMTLPLPAIYNTCWAKPMILAILMDQLL